MLDDPAVRIEAKNIDTRPRSVPGPLLETVVDDVVPLGDDGLRGATLRLTEEVKCRMVAPVRYA